jgi:hypothetical protein
MEDWSRALPAVQFIFNTTKHRDIGYTSADLLFGPAVNPNRFIMDQHTLSDSVDNVAWWDQQNEIHADILKTAAELQKETDEKRLQKRAGVPTTYPVGSYVLVEYPKTMGGGRGRPPNKLQTIRKGPMKVIANEKDAYDLLDLVSRTVDTVHVSRLYPFLYDPKWVDPETVAIRDQGEFVVVSIVDSLMDDMPKAQWQFKVRWAGYDESYDEWLDWNSLKNVEA